jgi:apolipoprotein N-acyltransferase
MKKNIIILIAGCFGIVLFVIGPFGMENRRTFSDFIYLGLTASHLLWAAAVLLRQRLGMSVRDAPTRVPEILVGVTLMFALFSYIFATNANMDYVQRFAESEGNLRLAPDSLTERLNSLLRFCPLLLADFLFIVSQGIRKLTIAPKTTLGSVVRSFALPIALVSSFLYTAALPSFVKLEGLSLIAYVCLIPLFLVLAYAPKWWGVMYGTVFGVIQSMLTNHWLGTFSLVSLQLITGVYLLFYALFMTAAVGLFKRFGRRGLLLLPFLWVIFDYLRSLGFIGYPWGFLGVSQYGVLPLIQIASVTGIWGVTLIVLMANGVFAFTVTSFAGGRRKVKSLIRLPAVFLMVYAAVVVFGLVSISVQRQRAADAQSVKIALIQQNADPRKHNYKEVFEVLKSQTDSAMEDKPDLVVWSETAFVPNIRRWSKMDPDKYPYARLVNEFLAFQKNLDVWLLTGNDDYELIPLDGGKTERYEYNAAVFFDPSGNRLDTYRKIHLVPFTEYFPFKENLPKLYEWLKNSDVYLWEPGTERVIFEHPLVRFSTPICFEDGFPQDVREFVRAGAELIINISNDYWSLTEVEAQQHFANSLFRAIENRRPMLRASASGVTCGIDTTGLVTARLPFYEEGFLVTDVKIPAAERSIYTRYGNWLPLFAAGLLALFCAFSWLKGPLKKWRHR